MSATAAIPVTGTIPTTAFATEVSGEFDALVLPIATGEDGPAVAVTGLFDDDADVAIFNALSATRATGSLGEVTTIAAPVGVDIPAIVAVGLGDWDSITEEKLRRAAGTVARALAGFDRVATTLGSYGMQAAVEGIILGAYRFSGHRAANESATTKLPVGEVVFIHIDEAHDKATAAEAKEAFVRGVITAEAVCFARDLVNTPPLDLYPESYAAIVKAQAKKDGLDVEILDEKQLAAQGFGGIMAVGQGSSRGPRLVKISYSPKKAKKSVALVGKGITFDTGGISLKPGKGMSDMTCDMAGSAAVAAAIFAAARLKLNVAVTAWLPLAENMPGGKAQRPGDVITHYGGLTSEVLNTDAEGRLVLADAIARACEDNPDYLIETATLTGAQMAALGLRTAGAMGTDDFRDRVAEIGRSVGENTWSMPIPEEVNEDVTGSDVADVRNIAESPYGGMQAAAAYLQAAVTGDVPWVHLDVAGPAWNGAGVRDYTPKRGTGSPTRTIVAALADIANNG